MTLGKGGESVLGNDLVTVALKAWTALTVLLHREYDGKLHASCLQAHKQVMQVLFKKLERTVKNMDGPRAHEEKV